MASSSDRPVAEDGRTRRRLETRQRIQRHALRLFEQQGFDTTTVEEVAAAAGVSHMTVYRHFRTKEDLVVDDDYDPLLEQLIVARPADEPPIVRIRRGMAEAFTMIYETDVEAIRRRVRLLLSTPALHAKMVMDRNGTETMLARLIAEHPAFPYSPFRAKVLAAACIGALTTAIIEWASPGTDRALPDLVDEALTALEDETGGHSCQTP